MLDLVEVGTVLNLPVKKSSHRHANDGHHHHHHSHRHPNHKHSTWCQRSYHHVMPTLENWVHLLAEAQKKVTNMLTDSLHIMRSPTLTEISKIQTNKKCLIASRWAKNHRCHESVYKLWNKSLVEVDWSPVFILLATNKDRLLAHLSETFPRPQYLLKFGNCQVHKHSNYRGYRV